MKDKDLINIINDSSLTTKERGDALENYIKDFFNDKFNIDLKKTKGSGALHGDGDLKADEYTIDGKVHGKCTSISVKKTEIEKIRNQAAINDKIGIISTPIVENNKVKIYFCIEMEDFIELTKKENTIGN